MKNCYSCRVFILLALLFTTNATIFAQRGISKWIEEIRQTGQFSEEKLVQSSNNDVQSLELKQGTSFDMDNAKLLDLWANPRATVTLTLPIKGRLPVDVELAKIAVVATDFKVLTSKTLSINPKFDEGVHYRGIVKGDAESIVAISIYKEEIRGFIADKTGRYEIGKEKNQTNSDHHIIYEANDLKGSQVFACGGSESKDMPKSGSLSTENLRTAAAGIGCKTVSVFFECDYQMYLDNGSNVTNVTNYVTSFFNQVATLYQNENIDIQISQIYVWTTPDPYRALITTGSVLQAYDNIRGGNFTGTVAHFLTTRNIGGGIAYLNVLCNKPYAHGVSMIFNTFATYPTFSWTVDCVTHELGHNFGSNHTQWCGWKRPDGTTGPLDNCTAVEGTCTTTGATPITGGTIMSYCHRTSYGINFANGFGTLPGDAIRLGVTNATCLTATTSTSAAPTGQQTTNILANSATLSWNVVPNVGNYVVEYKASSAISWTVLGNFSTTKATLNTLLPAKSYDWRVKCDCSGYSTTTTFSTAGTIACIAPFALTSINLASTSATLIWNTVSGATNYTIQYKKATEATWTTAATVSTNSYSLTGLTASTAYNWQIKASCSGYSATANFSTATPLCIAPTALVSNSITGTSAMLVWKVVSGATSYTIQYKKVTTATWTTAATVTSNSYNLAGLTASTAYNWQVKANCSGYSASAVFNTITLVCAAPASLASNSVASTSALLVWNAVSGATNYVVQFKKSNTTTWTTAATVTSNSYALTALTASTAYNWQVKASCSGYSATANFSTITAVCAAPSGLLSSNIASTSATLTWGAVSGATSYTIQYRKSNTATWTTATTTTNTYNLVGLATNIDYIWQVKASCSGYSAIVFFSTAATTCAAPTVLTSINIASNSATLVWNSVSGAANYTVQYKPSTTTIWLTAATVASNAYSLTGLLQNTNYDWKIKASCSVYSSVASFSTPFATAKLALITDQNSDFKKEVNISLPNEKAKFSIYPNPAQHTILLNISNDIEIGGEAMYRIVDFRGNVRKIQKIKEITEKIDISDLENGTYIIQMLSKSGIIESKTLVKE